MDIKLIKTDTTCDLETIGIVETDCKTIGEFVAAALKQCKSKPRFEVGGQNYTRENNKDWIDEVRYIDGWGGLTFKIKTKSHERAEP